MEAQDHKTPNPDSIKIITTDVDNFWKTYDNLSQDQTLTDTIQIIQKYYLDKASYGLQEYVKASNSTAKLGYNQTRHNITLPQFGLTVILSAVFCKPIAGLLFKTVNLFQNGSFHYQSSVIGLTGY